MASLQESAAATAEKEDMTPQERKDAAKIAKIDDAIKVCRSMYHSPLLSQKTKRMFDEMMQDVRSQKKDDWAEQNVSLLSDTINDARMYFESYRRELDTAVAQKWISGESRSRWIDRFHRDDVLEMERKEWLLNQERYDAFPQTLKRWQAAAEKRQEVEDMAQQLGVTGKDYPGIVDVVDAEKWLRLPYRERVNKAKDALSFLTSIRLDRARGLPTPDMKNLLNFAKAEMTEWADEGIMHHEKIGEWLERIIKSKNPQKFMSSVLYPYKKNWEKIRERYDTLTHDLSSAATSIPHTILSPKQFLLLDYGKRIGYCALLETHAETAEKDDITLSALKLRIETSLTEESVDMAKKLLKQAESLAPNDPECAYLSTLIDQKFTELQDNESTTSTEEVTETITKLIRRVPVPLRELYIKAAMRGPSTLNALMRSVHHRIRWYQAGAMNERTEHAMSAEQQTKPQSSESHFIESDKLPASVVLDTVTGYTANRDEADNNIEEGEYTLIPPIPYGAQYDLVHSVHAPLKRAIAALKSVGGTYES